MVRRGSKLGAQGHMGFEWLTNFDEIRILVICNHLKIIDLVLNIPANRSGYGAWLSAQIVTAISSPCN